MVQDKCQPLRLQLWDPPYFSLHTTLYEVDGTVPEVHKKQCFKSVLISIRIRIWIQHFRSIQIRIQVFQDQNERKMFSKFLFLLFSCWLLRRQWLRTHRLQLKPSGLQQNGECSFKLKISDYFSFLVTILTVLDPDPYSRSRGAISIPDPHGSRSETQSKNKNKNPDFHYFTNRHRIRSSDKKINTILMRVP